MSTRRRKGGSLVLPIVLITLGFLFLLDNLGALPDNAWNTAWQLWPVIVIAMGLEILLGRRVSFGAIFMLVALVVVVGAIVWGSIFIGDVETVQRTVRWPREGAESAEIDIDVGIGELYLSTQEDMSELLYARLEIPEDAEIDEDFYVGKNGRIEGQLRTRWDAFFALFSPGDWQVTLHPGVRLEELKVNSGIGDVELELVKLRIDSLDLDVGIGSAQVILPEPERNNLEADVHVGIGDIQVNIPTGVEARIEVDRGIGDLTVYSRFERHGDYYQTEGFDRAERYIELKVDVGIGSITLR